MTEETKPAARQTSSGILLWYSALILAFLLLPLTQKLGRWARSERRYASLRNDINCYHTRAIFEEKGDIDILIAGGSSFWNSMAVPTLISMAEKKLKRRLSVVVLGAVGNTLSFDLVKVNEILKQRRVKMLLLHLMSSVIDEDFPHRSASQWLRIGDWKLLAPGLTPGEKIQLYGTMVLGAPVVVADYFFSPPIHPCEEQVKTFGARRQEIGFLKVPFVPTEVKTPDLPPSEMIFGKRGKSPLVKGTAKTQNFEIAILKKFGELAKRHSMKIVHVELPRSCVFAG